jgi:hypothetical protein
MATSFIIFIRAIGIYALFTIPVIFSPPIYIISMLYVITFGWFACALFIFISLVTINTTSSFAIRMPVLALAVPLSVAFAFQLIEVFGWERDVWHSGGFLMFPVAATISGWVSLMLSAQRFSFANPDIRRPPADTSV